jgi:hypothetical protein
MMNKMAKLWIPALLLTVMTFSANAQQASPEARAQKAVTALSERVTVTAEQQQALQKTFTDYFENMQAKRGGKDFRAMKQLGEKRDAEVKGILQDETKYAGYKQFIDERKQQAREMKMERGNRMKPAQE